MSIALALDPGRTTGAAVGELENGRMYVRWSQHRFDHIQLWQQLELLKPDYLIIEEFEYRRGTRSREGLDLYPRELLGVAELWCQMNKKPIYRQKASEGKSYFSNSTLQSNRCYDRGKPHAMDAVRHLLQWFTFGFGYQYNTSGFEPRALKKEPPKLKKLTVYRKPGQ